LIVKYFYSSNSEQTQISKSIVEYSYVLSSKGDQAAPQNPSLSLKFIVESLSEGAQFAPTTFQSFELIVTLTSIVDFQLVVEFNLILHSEGAQAPSSALIVGYCSSKISFHFHNICRIFCEGVKEQINNDDANVKQRQISLVSLSGFNFVGLRDINGLIGQIGFIGLVGRISLVGQISLVSLSGISSHISLAGLIGDISFIGRLISDIGLVSFIGLSFVSLVGFISLFGNIGLVGCIGNNSLPSVIGLSLISLVSLISKNGFISLGIVSFIGLGSLVNGISLICLVGLIDFISLADLVSFGLNGSIGKGIIVNSLQFKIEMKQAHHDLIRKGSWLWCVWRVFSSLARLDSVFEDALQNAKQLFHISLPHFFHC
jgi:hypothetical protein